MTNKTTIKGLIAIIAITLQTQILFAQWTMTFFGGSTWYRLSPGGPPPGFSSVGVGNFTTAIPTLSALHVNTNLLPGNINFTPGEVFRTNGPAANLYNV